MVSTITDTFTRADSATGLGTTSDGNATWTQQSGTTGISSNQAYNAVGGAQDSFATIPGQTDGIIEFTLATIGGLGGTCAIWRVQDSLNMWDYRAYVGAAAGSCGFYKMIGGGDFQQTTTASIAWVAGDVMRVEFTGNVMVAKRNGVVVDTITNSYLNTMTTHGFGIAANTSERVDNFTYTFPPSPPPTKLIVVRQAVPRAALW